jgi:CspA family cold shock protein
MSTPPPSVDPPGSYPFGGDVEWIPAHEGGRSRRPSGSVYAAVGWREDVGPDAGLASFVLSGFDVTRPRSPARARWLVQQTAAEFRVKVGDVIVVGEGPRPVARFVVGQVEDQTVRWRRIESWLRTVSAEVGLESADASQVEEYLDHNELALAFEVIGDALADRRKAVSPGVKPALADAAADMGLLDDPVWRRVSDLPQGLPRAIGTVERWSDEEGWGCIAAPSAPGGVFAHFSEIEADGDRNLRPGERVEFDLEDYPYGQDGYYYRAYRVKPLDR